jgi:hypothetical protein
MFSVLASISSNKILGSGAQAVQWGECTPVSFTCIPSTIA